VAGDVQTADLGYEAYDAALMECVLSILSAKRHSLSRIADALKPGARLAVTDVTVEGAIPDAYMGVLSIAGCVGDARPWAEYEELLWSVGLELVRSENLPEAATATVTDVQGKLMLAEIAVGLGKLPLDPALIARGKELIGGVQTLIAEGTLSYCMLVAEKPS
jgi:hypothetical protein